MNRELLRRVADAIENETVGKFDMQTWGWREECGTVCCVAGHVAALLEPSYVTYLPWVEDRPEMSPEENSRRKTRQARNGGRYGEVDGVGVYKFAGDALGLMDSQRRHLFLAENAFPDLSLIDDPTVNITARQRINENRHLVPDALRWMAGTGIVDWNEALNHACSLREKEEQAA